jgi:hypothetical protein
VWFVPLAPLADSDLVLAVIARPLGGGDAGGRPLADRLAEQLRDRRLDDPWAVAWDVHLLGAAAFGQEDHAAALAAFEQEMDLARASGSPSCSRALQWLGNLAAMRRSWSLRRHRDSGKAPMPTGRWDGTIVGVGGVASARSEVDP